MYKYTVENVGEGTSILYRMKFHSYSKYKRKFETVMK